MSMSFLDPGLYVNIFPVRLPSSPSQVFVADRARYPDLRALRQELRALDLSAWVYADGERIYGYGPDAGKLEEKGFVRQEVALREIPALAARLILEGLVASMRSDKVAEVAGIGRWQLYLKSDYKQLAGGRAALHRGVDLRALFWRDGQSGDLAYGIVIDRAWFLRDATGRSMSLSQIAAIAPEAPLEVARAQEEILPGTARINTEVARLRLLNHLIPIARKHHEFLLPSGEHAELSDQPLRIILGGEKA